MAKTVTKPIVTCDDCGKQFKLKIKVIFKETVTEVLRDHILYAPTVTIDIL